MTSRSRILIATRRSIAVTALLSASAVLVLAGCHRKQEEAASDTSSARVVPDSAANSGASAASGAAAAEAAPAAASAAAPASADAQQIDVASLSAGAFAVGQSGDDWFRLLDGVPDSPGIQVNSNPYELVLALPGDAQIASFAFVSSPQRQVTPHHVKVDTAASANGPWTTAYDADIPGADNIQPGVVVRAPLAQPVTAKFLRLTLSSPPEQAPNGIGLSRFSAYGTPGAAQSVREVAGLYHFPLNFGSSGYVLLQQQGASVEGCYFESQGSDPVRVSQVLGTIVGGIEQGGYLRLARNEQQSKLSTPGIMAFSPDGKQAFSALFTADAHTFSNVAESPGERVGPSKLTCDPSGGQSDPVASQLEQTGHVQLYGVNFDLDKSTLRADAKPVLDRMATLLKAHADWKIEVAGHTDSTGEDAHNMKLSQDRADAVAQYLKSAGVTSTLTSKGYGSTQPLVPNTTDALRAQNRRVELVKQ
ncbi:OmpA family protein [Paraburkholderia sp.]|uniref:OmpA family protein n=1 Tax=Paraburkholderia sp. TaxID=1926495 RepID=UPI0039E40DD9